MITRIDRRPVESSQGLRNVEGLMTVGRALDLDYLREGRERRARVTLNENLDERISGQRLDARLDGLVLVRLPEQYVQRGIRGVVVDEVRRNTPAWEAGLREGDLIVAVNREEVRNLGDFRREFPIAEEREISLEIRRRGRAYLAVLD